MTLTNKLIQVRTLLVIACALTLAALYGAAPAHGVVGNVCLNDAACVPAAGGAAEQCVGGFCAVRAAAAGNGDGCATTADCNFGEVCQNLVCVPDFGVGKIEANTQLGNTDFIEAIVGIINVVLGLLGIIAVVIILFAGFKWMTAGGSEDKTGEARKMIVAGVIGLAIILSAWAISKFVIAQLAEATGSPGAENLQNQIQ